MAPKPAKELYDQFCCRLRQKHTAKVAEGIFGAYMEVSLVCFLLLFTARRVVTFFDQINDGPVTMMVDSKDRTPGKTAASKA